MESSLDEVWRSRARSLLTHEPHGAHLLDESWVALAEGRPMPGRSDALDHLARCAECRDILRAVHLLKAESRALDRPPSSSARTRWPWAVAGVAAMLVAGAGVWMVIPPPTADDSTVAVVGSPAPAVTPTPAPFQPSWLRITVPTVAIYSPDVLTMRGAAPGTFADVFADAMVPWRAGRYREAADRLHEVTTSHPTVAEGHFYKGVALLLAGAPAEAITPLERGKALAPAALAPDASWYLGLALFQSGRPGQASRAFDQACRAGRPLACEAAAEPSPDDPSRP